MKTRIGWAVAVVIVVAAWAVAGEGGAFGGKTGAEIREEAMKALGDDSIREAAKTADSEGLLGLAILATGKAGAAAAAAAVKADSANEAVLLLARSGQAVDEGAAADKTLAGILRWAPGGGIDAGDAAALIVKDPSNALGYYLQAFAFLRTGNVLDAVAAMKQATECERLDTYDDRIVRSIIKGLDALRLKGAARLAAVERVNFSRVMVWNILSGLPGDMERVVTRLPEAERNGVADTLLGMAGQLGDLAQKSPRAKMAQYNALVNAFKIKQRIAKSEESPREQAYAATISMLDKNMARSEPSEKDEAVSRALAYAFYEMPPPAILEKMMGELPPEMKATVEKALKEMTDASERFIGMALKDLDAIIKKELEEGMTPVGIAEERGELVSAAETYMDEAQKARDTVEQAVPAYKSQQNLKKLGIALLMYATDYDGKYPPDLETLAKEGYVTDKTLLTSPLSGKPYAYIGGIHQPGDSDPRTARVLVYDEKALGTGEHIVLRTDGGAGLLSPEEFKEQTKESKK
jgi:hypothetical protein